MILGSIGVTFETVVTMEMPLCMQRNAYFENLHQFIIRVYKRSRLVFPSIVPYRNTFCPRKDQCFWTWTQTWNFGFSMGNTTRPDWGSADLTFFLKFMRMFKDGYDLLAKCC